jgi:hypothetical protein
MLLMFLANSEQLLYNSRMKRQSLMLLACELFDMELDNLSQNVQRRHFDYQNLCHFHTFPVLSDNEFHV